MSNAMPVSLSLKPLAWGAIALASLPLAVAPAQAQPTINPGFSPNPLVLRGTGGGSTPAQNVAGTAITATGECTGYVEGNPDQTIVLRSFFKSLRLKVQSPEDTSLVIKGPGGVWCNDDDDDKNPGVTGQWLAGTYRIWVGSYAKDRRPPYTLRLRENP
jgi:hypothetical protein